MLRKHAIKWGVIWRKKSLEIKGFSQRMWCTNRLSGHTSSDFYGVRTPTSTPYEPFLSGWGWSSIFWANRSSLDGPNRQSQIASVQRTRLTLAGHFAVHLRTNPSPPNMAAPNVSREHRPFFRFRFAFSAVSGRSCQQFRTLFRSSYRRDIGVRVKGVTGRDAIVHKRRRNSSQKATQ